MDREIMTIEELAKYLQISKATLYQLLMRKRIPGTKIGKRWRFRKDSIDKWLLETEEGPNKPNPNISKTESILSEDAIKTILGINEPIHLTLKSMVDNLHVTFFPIHKNVNKDVIAFIKRLHSVLVDLGAQVIPYEQALEKQNRIKRGIAIIAAGDGEAGHLPIDYVANPRFNPIVAVAKTDHSLERMGSFEEHMGLAIQLFAQNMSNITICLNGDNWIVYSLNGFSSLYKSDKNFDRHVLRGLIPKLAVPLRPPLLSEFKLERWDIEKRESFYEYYINDILKASRLFKQTALYPPAQAFDMLNFRSAFYKKVGKRYLDRRSGMSYGFFARQLPVDLSVPIPYEAGRKNYNFPTDKECFEHEGRFYLLLNVLNERFYLSIPDVWAITTRSGCEKTDIDRHNDLIKVGLIRGKMVLSVPDGINLTSDYKPSFDTRLILSHSLANAIFASILVHFKPAYYFSKTLKNHGMALAHWHSSILVGEKPKGWYIYGIKNPAVSCSAHQASIYAFRGKEKFFAESLFHNKEYSGDIHIEPHHGVNVTYRSLVELAELILQNPKLFKFGALKLQER